MIQVESAIKKKAPGSLYGEWAKKEECWQYINKQSFSLDLASISADIATTGSINKRQVLTESGVLESVDKEISSWLSGIPVSIWNAIDHWGLKTGKLSIHKRTTAQNIAVKIRSARPFTESELQNGVELVEFIMEAAPELFDESVQESTTESNVDKGETNNSQEIITEAATVEAAVWLAAARWGKSTGKLDKFGQSLCYSLGYLAQKGNLPSIRQATYGLRILVSAEEKGFVKPT